MSVAKQEKQTQRHWLARLLFLAYAIWMLWLLFGQRWGEDHTGQLNLQPMATIDLFWRLLKHSDPALVRRAVINLAGNVIMFVPLGYFPACIFPRVRGFFKTLLLSTAVIVAVELTQLATGLGSCDIDDLMLNLIGAVIGWLLWRIGKK